MPKAKKEGPSWRTVMRRSKAAKTPREAKKLRDQAHAMRREERAKAKGPATVPAKAKRIYVPKQTKTLPNVGFDKAANWGKNAVPMSGDGSQQMQQREARHLPPNTLLGEDSKVNEDLVTTFDVAVHGVMKAAKVDNVEAVQNLLRDFAMSNRNYMEREHIETLKRVHEANAANVVRSYMAMIDGLGHAHGGPVPPYVVIPGLMAVRVYDALQKAGHKPD